MYLYIKDMLIATTDLGIVITYFLLCPIVSIFKSDFLRKVHFKPKPF